MKTTMKNREHLNKITRNLRKITMQFIMALLILAFASCEKEELLEPVQEVHKVDKAVKWTAPAGSNLSLRISRLTNNAAYGVGYRQLKQGCTVRFNGNILAATTKLDNYERPTSHIWSSSNGSDWNAISRFPNGMGVTNMVVYDNKLWALSKASEDHRFSAYTSTDGRMWNRVPLRMPFYGNYTPNVVVFNNNILVFGYYLYSSPGDNAGLIYSFDGNTWDTVTPRGLSLLDGRSNWGGASPIVFKDALYIFPGDHLISGTSNGIYKSTNGREWSRVSGATPNYLNPTEDFPVKLHHATVVYDNKVWITGGRPTNQASDASLSNDIWYSSDMKNWRKYTGYVSCKALFRPTLLSHNNEMLLLGGIYKLGSRSVASKYVWSIKPRSTYRVPDVEIPRNRPTIPLF